MCTRLPQAIRSVKEQDYENLELIVVDDGSDEEQLAVFCEQLAAEDGKKIKLLSIAHSGKPSAVNRAFKEAKGDYLTILDADDYLPKNSISSRIKALARYNADLCVGSLDINYEGKTKNRRDISKIKSKNAYGISSALLTKIISPFHQNSMMFSAELLAGVGGMNPKMKRGQDKDFAIKLLQKSTKTVFVDETVYTYNRYDRPLKVRLHNRFLGAKFHLFIISCFFKGTKKGAYLVWVAFISTLKMGYDLFGVYKK